MRILVVGAGRMGAIRAADLRADSRVEDVMITNRSPERARKLADKVGATPVRWEDWTTLETDATVVSLASAAHDTTLDSVLRDGRPVLCEKPIALTLSETERVIDLAHASGCELQIGFQRRFDPGLRAIRQRIAAGDLGTLYAMRLMSHDHQPSPAEFIASSGGMFRDLHVHDLDVVSWLADSAVATVYATSAVREHPAYAEADDADVSLVSAVTESGVQVSISGARHDPRGHDVRVEVFGSLDSVAAGLTERTPLRAMDGDRAGSTPSHPYTGFVDRFREAFRAETAAFVDLVSGGPNLCPPETSLASLRAAIACEESVRTRRPVQVAAVRDRPR